MSVKNAETDQELRHEPVQGYGRVFLVAAVILTIYLMLILFSSPGKVKGHGKGDKSGANIQSTES